MFVAVLTAFASCSAQPPDAPVPITLGGAPFTELRHAELSRPVLWPVLDRAGRALTRAWPLADAPEDPTDHPHQRSVWFAHGAVNGIDFWSEARG
ncbi:MAG TPA: DUF6807 family protein, partial [Planctomycetota bacterium]|nr:DUF6807 family protein [Planctomycetota bacterium]